MASILKTCEKVDCAIACGYLLAVLIDCIPVAYMPVPVDIMF
jgi:hypothetical protein